MMSGVTPAQSQANHLPVRPNPVATSSAISSTSCWSQSQRASSRNQGWYMLKPP